MVQKKRRLTVDLRFLSDHFWGLFLDSLFLELHVHLFSSPQFGPVALAVRQVLYPQTWLCLPATMAGMSASATDWIKENQMYYHVQAPLWDEPPADNDEQ